MRVYLGIVVARGRLLSNPDALQSLHVAIHECNVRLTHLVLMVVKEPVLGQVRSPVPRIYWKMYH